MNGKLCISEFLIGWRGKAHFLIRFYASNHKKSKLHFKYYTSLTY